MLQASRHRASMATGRHHVDPDGQGRREPRRERDDVDGVAVGSSRSRYSASDSWPVDRASPKLTLGRGENPSV